MTEKLYVVADVAKIEKLTTRTVSEKCKAGEFPGAYKTSPNGFWRIPESAIAEYRRLKAQRPAAPGRIEPLSPLAAKRRQNRKAKAGL